ncbi:MAG: hypothetical protein K0S23_609 [Fluviicola sp.]|jgi:hypothetical protein|uniref:hypothetical protein n=1 Tax=Fluviicola sp. TaxID=1917219 RepID=UPI00262A9A35|nr:hypothetical protein [Fluviicola sp.]MDF3026302.1 hypothetical protein [Fluviicola sp.]
MKISNNKTVVEIEEEFNKLFPYLRLKVFRNATEIVTPSQLRPSSLRKFNQLDDLYILPGMSIDSLEKMFRDEFDLQIKLFRKSGKEWIETKLTGHWTLEEQNREGEILSSK